MRNGGSEKGRRFLFAREHELKAANECVCALGDDQDLVARSWQSASKLIVVVPAND